MATSKVSMYFGNFWVTSQVFYTTQYSFALVNLKPLLPGHVLVSPRRVTPRLSDLSHAEVTDLFTTVQRVARVVEREFKATSLNIAIQDGFDAGQSVPHVHTHIIPRKQSDLDEKGGTDALYGMMEGDEGDIGKHQEESLRQRPRPKFPAIDDNARQPRTEAEMIEEARMLAKAMEKA